MERLSKAEFAQCAANNVVDVVGELQAKYMPGMAKRTKGTKRMELVFNLANLAGFLLNVSLDQEKYEQGEHQNQQDMESRLEEFLCLLEMICTFPKDCLDKSSKEKEHSARFPTLNTLVTQHAGSTTRPRTRSNVVQSVEKFASNSTVANLSFDFLRGFFEIRNGAKKRVESAQRNTKDPPKDKHAKKTKPDEDASYPKHVYGTLYKALQKYADCCCVPPNPAAEPPRRHWGRLELRDTLSTADKDVIFPIVFSKKGSAKIEKIKWQHLQFRIPREQRKGPSPRIKETDAGGFAVPKCDNAVQDSMIAHGMTEIRSASAFCELLGKDIGSASKVVRVINEMFVDLNRAEYIEVDITDKRSIPLAEVLDRYTLGPQDKLLLAYTLAKSVWQFYDSEFMRIRWTTESIQLFQDMESKEEDDDDDDERGVHWAPYYAFSFEEVMEGDSVERLPPGQFIHRYPRVLALGALLYELALKRSPNKQIRSLAESSPTSSVEPATLERAINDTAGRVRRGVERKKWPDIGLNHTESLEKYRIIVERCASESLFRPQPNQLSNEAAVVLTKTSLELEEELHIEERRAMLYEKVVLPLKELLQPNGWVNDSGNIPAQFFKRDAALRKDPVSQKPNPAALLTNTSQLDQAPAYGTQDDSTASRINAKEWLEEIRQSRFYRDILSKLEGNSALAKNKTRIAILDTGYDPDAIFFNKHQKRRLKDWKDYVEKDQPFQKDEDGHGTHVLSVLMKVVPAADIYVARVARNTHDLQNATQNVAEAIKWAWKDCKANIISMSFGFDEEIYIDDKPVISNSISEALPQTNQRILFFAAAANNGGNRAEKFPASNMQVLSIRGSDHLGCAQRFNPPPNYNGKMCFMTLGVDVPGASPKNSKDQGVNVYKSGTSVATPIAAGIAAMLLEYARIHEKELHEILGTQDKAKLSRLWSISGMSVMFEKMGTEMTNKWCYLSPYTFTNNSPERILGMIADAVREATG